MTYNIPDLARYAHSLLSVGKYKEAKVIWEKMPEPIMLNNALNYAITLYELDLLEDAKTQFAKKEQLLLGNRVGAIGRAAIDLRFNNSLPQQGIKGLMETTLKSKDKSPFVLRENARNLKNLGKLKEAAEQLKQAMEIEPENLSTALKYIGLLKEIDQKKASSLFEALSKTYPKEIFDYLTF